MTEITRIAIDTSKSVFTLHGVDAGGHTVLRRNVRRRELLARLEKLAPVEVVMEACGGSHHWGRALQGLGHRVRLIPPQYVKPFVKRSKNDRNSLPSGRRSRTRGMPRRSAWRRRSRRSAACR